jgi:hypothetical protein
LTYFYPTLNDKTKKKMSRKKKKKKKKKKENNNNTRKKLHLARQLFVGVLRELGLKRGNKFSSNHSTMCNHL